MSRLDPFAELLDPTFWFIPLYEAEKIDKDISLNFASPLRRRLLLITLVPLAAMLFISGYAFFQVRGASEAISQVADLEVADVRQATQEILEGKSHNVEQLLTRLSNSAVKVEALEDRTLISITWFSLLTIFVALFLNILVSRKIISSLRNAVSIARRIKQGERDIEIEASLNDETGKLLLTLKQMQVNIKQAEETLRKSEERFELAVRGSNNGLWDWDIETDEIYYSPQYKTLLGYGKDDSNFGQHVHPDDRDEQLERLREHLKFKLPYDLDYRLRAKDGSYKAFRVRGQAVWNWDGKATRMAGTISDVTERRRAQDELEERRAEFEKLSNTDALTDVYNRRYFMDRFEQDFLVAQRYNASLSILMLDIDFFKKINDTHGHSKGDVVLKVVSKMLVRNMRETDYVTRYGGEEFAIVLPQTDLAGADMFAERLRSLIEAAHIPIAKDCRIDFTCSIGVASYSKNTCNADKLIGLADDALYAAKESGRNRVVVSGSDKQPERSEIIE